MIMEDKPLRNGKRMRIYKSKGKNSHGRSKDKEISLLSWNIKQKKFFCKDRV